MVIDPWDNKEIIFQSNQKESENNKLNIIIYGKNIIKGPFSSNNKRYDLEFNYYYDTTQMCGCLNTINETNNYNNILHYIYRLSFIL